MCRKRDNAKERRKRGTESKMFGDLMNGIKFASVSINIEIQIK